MINALHFGLIFIMWIQLLRLAYLDFRVDGFVQTVYTYGAIFAVLFYLNKSTHIPDAIDRSVGISNGNGSVLAIIVSLTINVLLSICITRKQKKLEALS